MFSQTTPLEDIDTLSKGVLRPCFRMTGLERFRRKLLILAMQ